MEYVCGLFTHEVGVPPVDPPQRALFFFFFFFFFFASAPQSHPPLAFNWFERVHTALVDADTRLASWLAAGRSDRSFIPPRHPIYTV